MTQSWLSFPKTLEGSFGNTTGAVLKISLQESHSLKLEQHCDCRPPCAEGTSQYTSLKLTGMTALFGGEVGWEEELMGCEPGDGGERAETRTVYQSFSHAEGSGRWFGGGSPAVVTVGVEVVRTVALFGFSLKCQCREGECPEGGARYPEAEAVPWILHLIAGETAYVIVRARDEDGDLLPNSIRYPVSAGEDAEVSWLRVSPRSAGGSGGATGEAVFAVTALGVEPGDAELRFTVWDERGNKASLGIPVAIWRGRPSIDASEEETGWADGRCARPRLDDPDLADSDQGVGESTWSLSQSEPVADVGGSGTDEAISSTLGISPAVSGQWNGGVR